MRRTHGVRAAQSVVPTAAMRHLGGVACGAPDVQGRDRRKDNDMNRLISRMKRLAEDLARYRKTRDEIARMPLDVALDLDIFPGDAARIARKAVWG